MTLDPEKLAEVRRRVERSLGGRYRDGAECPRFVIELIHLARAETEGSPLPENADLLHKHFEVCPVCRSTYQAALAVARDETPWLDVEEDEDGQQQPATPESPSVPPRAGHVPADMSWAVALGDQSKGGRGPRRAIPVRRADALVDQETGDRSASTSATVHASGTALDIRLRDFLVPGPSQRVRLTWLDDDGAVVTSDVAEGPDVGVVRITGTNRGPESGDTLRIEKLDAGGRTVF